MDAARRYFANAIAEFGIEDNGAARIPMSQAELARRTGLAPSTVAAHLRSLGHAVIQKTPVIVLSLERSTGASAPFPPQAFTIRLELTIVDGSVVRTSVLPFDHLVGSGASAASATTGRGIRGLSPLSSPKEEKVITSCLPPPSSARENRVTGVAHWTDEELDEVLAPLHEATRGARLREMSYRRPVAEALRPYPLDVIRNAVEDLVAEVNRLDTQVRSPFGVLVSRARSGLQRRPTTPPIERALPTVSAEPEAYPEWMRSAVRALSPSEEADLDAFVAEREGGLVRMPPVMRQAMRLDYFEQWSAERRPTSS